jgi:hypothetical protein
VGGIDLMFVQDYSRKLKKWTFSKELKKKLNNQEPQGSGIMFSLSHLSISLSLSFSLSLSLSLSHTHTHTHTHTREQDKREMCHMIGKDSIQGYMPEILPPGQVWTLGVLSSYLERH